MMPSLTLSTLAKKYRPEMVVVIDEFDQLTSLQEHEKFSSLIKLLSDQRVPVRFIFCGIAESIEKLFSQHESVFRQIHSEPVDRLLPQACLDIIQDASKALKIIMPNDFQYRIAQVSDGFPAFVHLIAEKVFTATFDNSLAEVDSRSYEQGIVEAISSVELSLKRNYENALHKNTNKYEHVIWSLANDKLLDVNVDTIWNHYNELCDQLSLEMVSRQNLAAKLGHLTTEKYGKILTKVRRSNYTFSEKMMRAYARLRAERHNCILGPENAAVRPYS
jgi:hypothetical protein